jgi:hypothetical protein
MTIISVFLDWKAEGITGTAPNDDLGMLFPHNK